MTMITPSYLGETIEYSSLHACRSTLEDPTIVWSLAGHWMRVKDGLPAGRVRFIEFGASIANGPAAYHSSAFSLALSMALIVALGGWRRDRRLLSESHNGLQYPDAERTNDLEKAN